MAGFSLLLRRLTGDASTDFTASRPSYDRLRACFADAALERTYRDHLAGPELDSERLVWALMTAVYFLYGIVDLLTVGARALDVIAVRWGLLTPIAVAIALSASHERLRRYFGHLCAFGVMLSALSIIWMISVIPAGGPPYLVGILVVFIFASCNLRMPFLPTAFGYAVSTVVFAFVLSDSQRFSDTDRIAGNFFMISSAAVGVVTNYVQEIRVRLIWVQDRQRREDARRIADLMIEATAADQSKLNFLSILNHELRTPLHQIKGYSELAAAAARSGGDTAALDDALGCVQAASARLLALFAKMLRYADATVGKIRYEHEWMFASELAQLFIEPCQSRAEERGVRLAPPAIERAQLYVDAAAAVYAFGHLIENALNASPRGGAIIVSGAFLEDGAYVVEISDEGPGMSEDAIRRAFEPFEQTGAVRTRAAEGLGLGLPLAKKIFGDFGAEVALASRPGGGLSARVVFSPATARRPQSLTAAS